MRPLICQVLRYTFKLRAGIMLLFFKAGGGVCRRRPGSNIRIGPLPCKSFDINALQDAKMEAVERFRNRHGLLVFRYPFPDYLGTGEFGQRVKHYDWRDEVPDFRRRYKILRVSNECYTERDE